MHDDRRDRRRLARRLRLQQRNTGIDYTGGIVPDGVSEVIVTLGAGQRVTEPVHENTWMGSVPGAPVSVSFAGADGSGASSGG